MDKLTVNGVAQLIAYKPCILQFISIGVSNVNNKQYIM